MLAFDDLSEKALRAVVLDIINPEVRPKIETELYFTIEEIRDLENKKKSRKSTEYIPRGPTGRMAEEFFISKFLEGSTPFDGTLQDRRDDGVGFDFEIIKAVSRNLVEIKGIAKPTGGITFTDKEWRVANEAQDDYFLGLVIQVFESPRMGFVQNPARIFTPVYYTYTTVAINWAVDAVQIANIECS